MATLGHVAGTAPAGGLHNARGGWQKVQLLSQGNTQARRAGMQQLLRSSHALVRGGDADTAAVVNGIAAGGGEREECDEDGKEVEKKPTSLLECLSARLGSDKERMDRAATHAQVLRRQRRQLWRQLQGQEWPRWRLDAKTQLEMRVEALSHDIRQAEEVVPLQHARRKRMVEALTGSLHQLKALDAEGNLEHHITGGARGALSVRHTDAPLRKKGARGSRLKAPEEEKAIAREARLSNELLDMTLAHMFDVSQTGVILTNGRVCPRCTQDLVLTPMQQLLCPNCKIFTDASVLSASSILDADDSKVARRRVSGGQYFSAEHFMTRLKNVQGHFHRIPPKVLKDICQYIYDYSIPEHDWTNIWVIRETLAGVSRPKLYDHAPLISTYISGIQPPQLPAVVVSEISTMIKMLHKAWAAMQRVLDEEQANANMLAGKPVKPTNRNHPNAGLCLQHLGLLLGLDPLLKYNWSIWEANNVRTKQAMMKTAFGEHGWEMTTVDTPRQAGPAKGAVGRRVVACTLVHMTLNAHDWRLITAEERSQAHPLRKVRKRKVPLKIDPTRSRKVTECRGVNFRVARKLRRKGLWQDVEDITFWVTFWDMLLSDFNPWTECPGKIELVRRTLEAYSVNYIADYLREMEDNEMKRQTEPRGRRPTTASVLKRTTARAKKRAQRQPPTMAEVRVAKRQRRQERERHRRCGATKAPSPRQSTISWGSVTVEGRSGGDKQPQSKKRRRA